MIGVIAAPPKCFNPRLPCGRRLNPSAKPKTTTAFQSTPPMREATRVSRGGRLGDAVSIHASHAGGDGGFYATSHIRGVSIHASHAGGD